MELPMRALRSKDFPQDRQTKLQNTLTPLPLPITHTPPLDSLLSKKHLTAVDSG